MSSDAANRVTGILGYAGLIPFLLPAAMVALGLEQAPLASTVAGAYALAILCFLYGSWWGMAQASGVTVTLWLSNALLLAALALYLFTPTWWALAAAILLVVAWIAEQSRVLFPVYPDRYRRMRSVLTFLAAASMAVIQLLA